MDPERARPAARASPSAQGSDAVIRFLMANVNCFGKIWELILEPL
jgi:hypothetical protein